MNDFVCVVVQKNCGERFTSDVFIVREYELLFMDFYSKFRLFGLEDVYFLETL